MSSQSSLQQSRASPLLLLQCAVLLIPVVVTLIRKSERKKRDRMTVRGNSAPSLFSGAHERFSRYYWRKFSKSSRRMSDLSIKRTEDFDHQVAGHTCEVLRRLKGNVLKPMVKRHLFCRELALYEEMACSGTHTNCNTIPRALVPEYRGLALVDNNDSNGASSKETGGSFNLSPKQRKKSRGLIQLISHSFVKVLSMIKEPQRRSSSISIPDTFYDDAILPHIVLGDLTGGYAQPCAIDIKMGQQTYEPTASEDKKARERLKCPYQSTTGFRITGFKVYDIVTGTFQSRDKFFGRSLTPEEVADGLSLFFKNGMYLRRDVILATIEQLERIHNWLRSQTSLHFYCSSLLIIYDGSVVDAREFPAPSSRFVKSNPHPEDRIKKLLPLQGASTSSCDDLVKVKMIDFAHTLPSTGGVDQGYLLGLKNLIACLYQILKE
jgi:hypothetical protein